MDKFLKETKYINFSSKGIKDLAKNLTKDCSSTKEKVTNIHNFVRDEIKFGFTPNFYDMKANEVLESRVGYCNTKSTLFIALLRSINVPCRQHFVSLDKQILAGVVDPGTSYVDHSFTEIYINDKWIKCDSYIVDKELYDYAKKELLKNNLKMGYGLHSKGVIEFDDQNDCMAQYVYEEESISVEDFGIFEDVEDFYTLSRQNSLNIFLKGLFWFYMPYVNYCLNGYRNSKI